MNTQDLVVLLSGSVDTCAEQCLRAIRQGTVALLDAPGRVAAREGWATFSFRRDTLGRTCVGHCGFESTLAALKACDDDEDVLLLHLTGANEVFTVFVRERDLAVLGCIGVERSTS